MPVVPPNNSHYSLKALLPLLDGKSASIPNPKLGDLLHLLDKPNAAAREDLANVTAGQLLEVTQKYEVKLQALEKELSMLNAKLAIATTDKESLKKELRNLLANFQKEQELYKNEKEALKKALDALSATQTDLQTTNTALHATQAELQSTKTELQAVKETLSKMTVRMDNSDAQVIRILNLFAQVMS